MSNSFVDLGLTSKTLWAKRNEKGLFIYVDAIERFGDSLPTVEQVNELINECQWNFDNRHKGFKVIGKNGNYIFLPLADKHFGFYHTRSMAKARQSYALSLDTIHKGEVFSTLLNSNFFVRLVTKESVL